MKTMSKLLTLEYYSVSKMKEMSENWAHYAK